MATLAILESDPRAAARLTSVLGGVHRLIPVDSWGALERLFATDRVDGCVVDIDASSRDDATATIRRIRRRHPAVAVVAHVEPPERGSAVFELGRQGVHAILQTHEHREPQRCRDVVARAIAGARAGAVGRWLDGRFDADLVRAVVWSVEHALDRPDVASLARAMGVPGRRLNRQLRDGGLPFAGRLLLMGRLLLAGSLLGRDGHTVEDTAYMLGYSTGAALTRAMKRETGLTPSQVARRGGMTAVFATLFPRGRKRHPGRFLPTLLTGLVLVTTAGCASTATSPARPAPTEGRDARAAAVTAVLDAPPMDQVHFGVLAVDAATGQTLFVRDAHRKFIPASNQKVLGTAAALSLLGPEWRYRTGVWARGTPTRGEVEGPLVVVASGDPSLSDRFWPSGTAALEALADSVRAAGIVRVRGDLVIDASAWDSASVGPTWEAGDLPFRYAATGGAFAVDEGELQVVVRGGMREGDPAVATWTPFGRDDFVEARLHTAAPDSTTRVRASYLPESRRIELTGRVAPGATDTVSFALRDPVREAAGALHRALRRRGVRVDGDAHVAWDSTAAVFPGCHAGATASCPGAWEVAALQSPAMGELVAGILEPSQNWMTEQVVRTLGAELGDGGSWSGGLDVIVDFLTDRVGVDSLDVAPRDGSGLSAYNLVTPRALVAVLRYMADGPHARLFRHAMAEPGEQDSTLERRLDGLEGRVYAKTGTISNVNSLSGYLVGDSGREIVFSILSNGSGLPASRVRASIDEVVRAMARW